MASLPDMKGRYGAVGREFTATSGRGRPLTVGEVLPALEGELTTLKVLALDGQTFSGSNWYRYRVVPASDAEVTVEMLRRAAAKLEAEKRP